MSPNFKYTMLTMLLLVLAATMISCTTPALQILDGATHAKGTIHVEGYFTDSQGEVVLCKVPDEYTAEQAEKFCTNDT